MDVSNNFIHPGIFHLPRMYIFLHDVWVNGWLQWCVGMPVLKGCFESCDLVKCSSTKRWLGVSSCNRDLSLRMSTLWSGAETRNFICPFSPSAVGPCSASGSRCSSRSISLQGKHKKAAHSASLPLIHPWFFRVRIYSCRNSDLEAPHELDQECQYP